VIRHPYVRRGEMLDRASALLSNVGTTTSVSTI
jgi:hypothetical protein